MTAPKFTPGPWTYTKCRCGHPACRQYTISVQDAVGFDEPDARLIAAAPAMHAALVELLKMAELSAHQFPLLSEAKTKARAALAKVEG
jgi:hypothetical protein